MAHAHSTNTSANPYNAKLPSSDGVFPTSTMQLHHRLFGWRRKRHIPVQAVRGEADAEPLNSYMIDAKYLPKTAEPEPTRTVQDIIPPAQPVKVYQYSRLAHNLPASMRSTLTAKLARWKKYVAMGAVALTTWMHKAGGNLAATIGRIRPNRAAVTYNATRGAKAVHSRPRIALVGAMAVASFVALWSVFTPFSTPSTPGSTPSTVQNERSQSSVGSDATFSSSSNPSPSSIPADSTTSTGAVPIGVAESQPTPQASSPASLNPLPVGGYGGGDSTATTPAVSDSPSPSTTTEPSDTTPIEPSPTDPLPLPSTPLDPVLDHITDPLL